MTALTRRELFKVIAGAGAGLVIGFRWGADLPVSAQDSADDSTADFEPNAYLIVGRDGLVTIRVHRSEMGQGVQTAVPMIIAEELAADWASIRIEQAPADPVYGDQITGGSYSLQGSFATLLRAGGAARLLLVEAAAQRWGVAADTCRAENSRVYHDASGQSLGYGELVDAAQAVGSASTAFVPKAVEDYSIIGTPKGQLDEAGFLTGSAVYGMDVRLPEMRYAALARCPVFGGRVASVDSSAAEAAPGVERVIVREDQVAVVASSTWAAIRARDLLNITWDPGRGGELSTGGLQALFAQGAAGLLPAQPEIAGAQTWVEALYETPYFAHATLEPMNCTADVRADGCDIWVPTQDRQAALSVARSVTRLPRSAVNIHVTMIGGGFGRRLQVDYVEEAVRLSVALGAPVQVVWTRDDDFQHDYYHSGSAHQMRAALDADGAILSWEHYVVAQGSGPGDFGYGDRVPYAAQSQRFSGRPEYTVPIPIGAWRSVFNHQNAFANECFVDELAAAAGQDPYAYRMRLLDESAGIKPVLELAATRAGWGAALPDGWGRGIAGHTTFGVTHVAHVVDVELSRRGAVQVRRVVCAIDCGLPVNPDGIAAQMEGGIVFGLTAALKRAVAFEGGRVQTNSFRDYPLLTMPEMPAIEVHILNTGSSQPMGIGEMGVPPVAPALFNAIYNATGVRLRRLPADPDAL